MRRSTVPSLSFPLSVPCQKFCKTWYLVPELLVADLQQATLLDDAILNTMLTTFSIVLEALEKLLTSVSPVGI